MAFRAPGKHFSNGLSYSPGQVELFILTNGRKSSGYDSMFPASRRIVRNVPSCLMFVQPWLYASSFAYILAFVQRCHLLCVLFCTELDRDHLQSG